MEENNTLLFGLEEESQATEQAVAEQQQCAETTETTEAAEESAEQSELPAEDSEETEEQAPEDAADDEDEEEGEESAEGAETKAKAKKESKPNPYEQIVLTEMNRRAAEGDELLAAALQSKDKTISECWRYITAQARKKAAAGCAMIEDAVVFGWAHHYYIESKETIDKELAPKPAKVATKTAEQKKAEETAKKIHENPLLAALMKKGARMAADGEVAVTKTTERKDADGKVIFSKAVKTDASGTKTTTIEREGKKYTMTEFSLF